MKIAESQVRLESLRTYSQSRDVEERLQVQLPQSAVTPAGIQLNLFDLSDEALAELQQPASGAVPVDGLDASSDQGEQKARLVEAMLYAITGKRVHILRLDERKLAKAAEQNRAAHEPARAGVAPAATRGFAFSYDYHSVSQEREQLQLDFAGTVKLASGERIDFALQMQLERVSVREESLSVRVGQMVDPLVVNLSTPTATLRDQRFAFDLTGDGVEEQIAELGAGSAFLVLDRNGDGIVNNGLELFGTQSGDGFADLAQFDVDGNNWIDEADPAFQQLRLWIRDGAGERLETLAEQGIGALYLGSVSAQFELQGESGEQLGQQQRAGLFLRENRTVGTMQHIDLRV